MKYNNFELLATQLKTIKESGKKRITFQLQVSHSPAGELPQGCPTEYDAREMREHLQNWDNRNVEWPEVISLGDWLGRVLLPHAVRELLVRSLDIVKHRNEKLRIRLLVEDELHNIPWEYVLLNRAGGEASATDFLGLMPEVSLVRHQAATLPVWDVKAELPARMLIALASPDNYPMLNLDEERQVIEQALEGNSHIQASFLPQASSEALLADVGQMHLFHFAGHGDFETWADSTPGTMEGEGVLIFDDGYGDPAPITAAQLALQLRKLGVRVAVLGACRTGRRDNVNTWSSVATALLKADVGAVVGMQHMIRDDSAIVFAKNFYRALVSGVTIDEALANGRIAMALIDPKGWATPVLYMHAPDGVIFPEYEAEPALEKEREQLRVNARQQVKEVYGKLTDVKVKTMKIGTIEAEQNIGTVGEGGEATAVEIGEMSGGTVEADQKADTVENGGSMTGVSIDRLG